MKCRMCVCVCEKKLKGGVGRLVFFFPADL